MSKKICGLLLSLWVANLCACYPSDSGPSLSAVKSPYFAMSENDSISWQSWNSETLKKAESQNRLIYLSIGYATCFACEKMQKENYDDKNLAKLLNQNFVPIKVDREERPDLDSHFLNMQSLMLGFGAWPIILILTPDLKPLFSFSYVKNEKLKAILNEAHKTWEEKPQEVLKKGQEFLDKIKPAPNVSEDFIKTKQLISDFYARYTHRFDTLYGGKATGNNFNTKFPVSDEMRLLLRHHQREEIPQARKMVEKTLSTVAKSALFDHVGGGFHRYSMSRDWNTPNFEKTLIDQAAHIRAFTDLARFNDNDLYRLTLQKIVRFLINDIKDSLGGFYSSIGGSLNFKEGLFYTWTIEELNEALVKKKLITFHETYQLGPPLRHLEKRRTLKRKSGFDRPKLKKVDKILSEHRKQRGYPTIDKKVVTAYNALLLSALSRVARLWNSDFLKKEVNEQMDYLLLQHRSIRGDIYRSSFHGSVQGKASLDDYAFLIDALIENYQTNFDEEDLLLALELQKTQDELFFNSRRSLYRFNQESRIEPLYLFRDDQKPSGQAMSFYNLIRLSYYFNLPNYRNKAKDIMDAYPEILQTDPISYAFLLLSFDFLLSNPKTLIIVGELAVCQSKASEFFNNYDYEFLFACRAKESRLPLLKGKKASTEKALTFYLCDKDMCSPALTSEGEVFKHLEQLSSKH